MPSRTEASAAQNVGDQVEDGYENLLEQKASETVYIALEGGKGLTYVITLTMVRKTLAIAEIMALMPRPIAEMTDPYSQRMAQGPYLPLRVVIDVNSHISTPIVMESELLHFGNDTSLETKPDPTVGEVLPQNEACLDGSAHVTLVIAGPILGELWNL
ncbi:hypothetical protein NMY22_g12199 [Coprinellus aureogranulatus]|nr:hypothetical protein NMY22_g12199 [Coprinellus aureogranulatus]